AAGGPHYLYRTVVQNVQLFQPGRLELARDQIDVGSGLDLVRERLVERERHADLVRIAGPQLQQHAVIHGTAFAQDDELRRRVTTLKKLVCRSRQQVQS